MSSRDERHTTIDPRRQSPGTESQPNRPTIMASKHAISAGHYLASEAGMGILNGGGNAIDAGVAAGLTMGVVQSDLVNIAGVAPIMMWLAEQREVVCIDGLGTWPSAMSADLFQREHGGVVPQGLLRTVVPGAPAAWLTSLKHYGTLSFAEVAETAIGYARDGFAIDAFMCEVIADNEEGYRRWPGNRDIYLPNGRPPQPGERFVQTDLGASLQYMADQEATQGNEGRAAGIDAVYDAFYSGDIARTIVDYHRDNGGLLAMTDLADYRVRFEPTVRGHYGGCEIHCCGPWSQGPSLAQVLSLLDDVELPAMGHNSTEYIHTVTEALKLAFADREAYFGDPRFISVPMEEMLAADYLAERRRLIRKDHAWPDLPPPGQPHAGVTAYTGSAADAGSTLERGRLGSVEAPSLDTSYVCAVDRQGNMFSATPSDVSYQSPVIPGTGLCPSFRGSQSRPDPAHPSSVAPGKRPRLTPNPALAFTDGKPFMAFGTPGGDIQVQAMAQFLINVVSFGMDVQSAIEAPRFGSYSFPSSFAPNPHYPGLLMVESRIDKRTRDSLAALGHGVEAWPERTRKAGSVCAIRIDAEGGFLHAGADTRRAGYALGR
jgi:gamma-glutamyltranspeptidase/glutathione hydrolase